MCRHDFTLMGIDNTFLYSYCCAFYPSMIKRWILSSCQYVPFCCYFYSFRLHACFVFLCFDQWSPSICFSHTTISKFWGIKDRNYLPNGFFCQSKALPSFKFSTFKSHTIFWMAFIFQHHASSTIQWPLTQQMGR